MKRFISRICCALLAIALLVSAPVFSGAATRQPDRKSCGENLSWTLDDEGLLTISGTGDMYSYEEGQHAPWNYFNVKTAVIEEGVTSIGDRAFSDCYNMKSIEIPDSVTSIGDYAFYRCYYLKTVSLPDQLCSVGDNPFVYCKFLTGFELSPDHPCFAFQDGMLLSLQDHRLICRLSADPGTVCVIPEGTQIIGDYAFCECEALRVVFIPDGVTRIGNYAFSSCDVLACPDFPQSLVTVGDYAFSGCMNFLSAEFKEGLTSIGEGAFDYCWSLSSIELPDTLIHLGDHPFHDCRCLAEFNMSEDHPLLGVRDGILFSKPDMKMIFYLPGNPAETYSVPQGISIIGEKAFSNGYEIRTIILPDSVRSIEEDAFPICWNTEEIVFSEGLEVIGSRAFDDMGKLKEAILPEGLKEIGDRAFHSCSALEKVVIPASVENIGEDIFANTDTLNLAVFVTEGSAGEEYCRTHNLTAVYPGQEIPEPETDLPSEFTAQYPGYEGTAELEAWTIQGNEAVYLAKTPDGKHVLLCGADHGDAGWTIIESTPLPEGTRVVLDDGLILLDLGFVRCAVCRYHDDVWGIEYAGWRDLYVGPKWVGFNGPLTMYYGDHPWGDLTTIDWTTLTDDLGTALKENLDVSGWAFAHQEERYGRTPIYTEPDAGSKKIADLMNDVPLSVIEKDDEWTHVTLGGDAEDQWKLDGWIRTGDLLFPETGNMDLSYGTNYWLYSGKDETVMLVTPVGTEEITGLNHSIDTWFEIGEMVIDGKEYWLMYECYTEKIGFILKEELEEAVG